jgi:hypothetical protein
MIAQCHASSQRRVVTDERHLAGSLGEAGLRPALAAGQPPGSGELAAE